MFFFHTYLTVCFSNSKKYLFFYESARRTLQPGAQPLEHFSAMKKIIYKLVLKQKTHSIGLAAAVIH